MNRKRASRSRYLSVELAHVQLRRGDCFVLRGVSWRIRPGQHWVLQGANGAGKTQLLKLIAGDVWPQPRPQARRAYRWRGELYREPLGVKEEIAYLGAERQDRYEHYRWNHPVHAVVGTGIERSDVPLRKLSAGERARVAGVMARLGIGSLARRRFLGLSQGERRLVLLARALAARPALLLLDEPLNGLDPANRARVLAALATLRHSGLPWIYATHRPEEAPPGATHLALLRNGRLRKGRWRPPRAAAGRPRLPRRPHAPPGPRARGAARPPLLTLQHATVWRGGRAVLRRVSMRIHAGDCWVVHGANGSGKSTLLAALYGELGIAEGRGGAISRQGHSAGTPLRDFQQRLGRVSPELQAALPRRQRALDCVVAGIRGAYALDDPAGAAESRAAVRALRLAGAQGLARREFGELSYGQARRVLFARALARQPDVLLLDEPYTGLDAQTRGRLQALVDRLSGMKRAVVIATHYLDDWPPHATHELELADGLVRYAGPLRRRGAPGRKGGRA